jgi:putative membrane protein
MTPPATAAPAPSRKGFQVPGWVLAVLGVLVVGAGAFIVGRAIARHHEHRVFDGRVFDGRGLGGSTGAGHPGFWLIVGVALVALIVAAVVMVVRHSSTLNREAAAPAVPSAAEEVLAQRFARGEIDEAEFRTRRDALRS